MTARARDLVVRLDVVALSTGVVVVVFLSTGLLRVVRRYLCHADSPDSERARLRAQAHWKPFRYVPILASASDMTDAADWMGLRSCCSPNSSGGPGRAPWTATKSLVFRFIERFCCPIQQVG